MSIRYLDLSGAVNFWTNIKNFILSKIPTKTSELTNDSGFLTQHQSLSNYVTLNSEQTITGKKLFTASSIQLDSVTSMYGSTMFIDTSASAPRGQFPTEIHRVGRIYIGDGQSYNSAWFIVDPIIDTNRACYRMVTTNPDNTDSTRFSIVWDSTKEGVRRRKNVSQGDLLPAANNTYNLGADDLKWDIGYIHNLIGSNKENASEDANNYYSTTSGSHMTFYTTSNGGTKLSNVPAAVNTQLESRTIRYLSASDWNVEQICHNTNGLYYRKGNNNGWGDWKTFAFTDSNITGKATNVTGTVTIAHGGTGATTRLDAVKALTNEAVSTPTYFLTITNGWGKAGYTTVAQAKTVLGITGDIVSHNASEFLTSHQSLSSCVKNSVTNSQTIKSTGITRGTAPSSEQTFGIAFSDKNNKYIGNIYGTFATDKSTYVGLYAYKGSTTLNSDNASVRVGYDASGNAYTYAPTPATADNSTQIATTAFVKAQGYLTSHPSITLSTNTTSTASPAHGGTFTCIDSVTQDTNGHITKVNTKTITLPADSNTDTKVTQTVTTGNSTYPVLLCATADATETGTTTSRFSAGLTVNTRYSSIYMTNKYDTANTKGVRNKASYSNGILYFRSYDDTQMGLIRCDSHKSGYQHIYMQASNYIKNGAISPEGTATTCSIAVRVRDNGSKTIYTEGSWENSLTPYANETYNLGTSSLRWMNCYCKNFYGSYVDIAGRYIGNEASTNGSTCLYLKSKRDTDGKSGLYVTKFRQNRAQGSMGNSDSVFLSHDILENETRTNAGFVESYSNWANDVPGSMSVYSVIATRNLGISAKPWTNAYITNLNLNGNAFDPASTSGNIGDIVFASAYYRAITGTSELDLTVSGNALFPAGFDNGSLIRDSPNAFSGTWKLLGPGKPTTTEGNGDTVRTGLWKRIA